MLASAIGRHIQMDQITKQEDIVGFAKICIEVDPNKKMLDKIKVVNMDTTVREVIVTYD